MWNEKNAHYWEYKISGNIRVDVFKKKELYITFEKNKRKKVVIAKETEKKKKSKKKQVKIFFFWIEETGKTW